MNTVKDILADNIVQMGLIKHLSLPYIATALGTAFLCGILIYCVYQFFYRGAAYSENFGLLIVMSTMTVAFIIMTISSNIVLSLGMVGALSIVRFRAAVKDPLDVGFLFLAIGAGLTAGAGLLLIALIGTVVICMVFIVMCGLDKKGMTYLLVVRCQAGAEDGVKAHLKSVRHQFKSSSGDGSVTELTYTLKVKDDSILAGILGLEGVENAVLVAYTGDGQY